MNPREHTEKVGGALGSFGRSQFSLEFLKFTFSFSISTLVLFLSKQDVLRFLAKKCKGPFGVWDAHGQGKDQK